MDAAAPASWGRPEAQRSKRRPSQTGSRHGSGIPVRWDQGPVLTATAPDQVWVFHRGRRRLRPRATAERDGFTVIDLSDDFTPRLFTEYLPGDDQAQPFPYRKRLLDLANDRTDHRGRPLPAGRHNYLELFGIPPTLSVLRRRMLDRRLRACLAKVDRAALRELPAAISAWSIRAALRRVSRLERAVARRVRRHRLARQEDLARSRGGRRLLRRLARARRRARAARAAIGVLRCEGMFPGRTRWRHGVPESDALWRALTTYERKHMILGRGVLTRRLAREMARSADEADADAFRRVLRERVVHGAAILEDGTARRVAKTWRDAKGRVHALPDLVTTYSRATLRALGLERTEAIRAFLTRTPEATFRCLRVAVLLPPRPAYYSRDMDLQVIISRGDVYYDPPVDEAGKRVPQYRSRLPSLTLYVRYLGQRIPLVRWRTTVGGWHDEMKDGQVYLRYKPSKVGPRVWRDILAAPVWIPPPTTPPREIVSGRKVKRDQMGPGPYSAYGLVAALHLLPRKRGGKLTYLDQGIRTHGSFNYRSIRAGYSHGCHRLYNHLAIRLFSFLLAHRPYHRLGLEPYPYRNRFEYKGRTYRIEVQNRGYVYRLDPPVPVVVTRGRVLGRLKRPIREYLPKPGVVYHVDDAGVAIGTEADGGVPSAGPPDADVPGRSPTLRPTTAPPPPAAPALAGPSRRATSRSSARRRAPPPRSRPTTEAPAR